MKATSFTSGIQALLQDLNVSKKNLTLLKQHTLVAELRQEPKAIEQKNSNN